MRFKTLGSKAKISKVPPKPSSVAPRVLSKLSNARQNIGLAPTIDYGRMDLLNRDDSNIKPTISEHPSNTSGNYGLGASNTNVNAQIPPILAPTSGGNIDYAAKADWTEILACIKCERGGEVLVCSISECPVALHEECMGCSTSSSFDDMGNFYCPYCSYKRALTETNEKKKAALLAKNALLNFIDTKVIDGDRSNGTPTGIKRKKPGSARVKNDSGIEVLCNSVALQDRSLSPAEDWQEKASTADQLRSTVPICRDAASLVSDQVNAVPSILGKLSCPNADMKQIKHELHFKANVKKGQEMGISAKSSLNASASKSVLDEGKTSEIHHSASAEGGERLELNNPRQVDGDHHGAEPGPHMQGASCYGEKETTEDYMVNISAVGEQDNAKILEVQNKRDEEEQIQLQAQERAFLSRGDPALHEQNKTDIRNQPEDEKEKNCTHNSLNEEVLVNTTMPEAGNSGKEEEEPTLETHANVDTMLDSSNLSHRHLESVGPHTRQNAARRARNKIHVHNVGHLGKSAEEANNEGHPVAEENARDGDEKDTASSKFRRSPLSSKRVISPALPGARRKKLLWSTEEEEMLKEGVHKFSATANKNLPWRKILDFGRHVFDGTRTPADLKDKWRNIMAKDF